MDFLLIFISFALPEKLGSQHITETEGTAMNRDVINRDNPLKICFVCLGNICRSPTAEGIFQHLVNKRDLQSYFEVDSAGTSAYHIGETANSKSQKVASQHGIELHSRARRFEESDLEYYDLVLAMDRENLENIRQLDRDDRYAEKVDLIRAYDPEAGSDSEVPDPYYGGMRGFHDVFEILHRTCDNLLDNLEEMIER